MKRLITRLNYSNEAIPRTCKKLMCVLHDVKVNTSPYVHSMSLFCLHSSIRIE